MKKENHLTPGGDLSSPALVRQLVWEIYGCFPTRVSLYGGGAFLIPYFIFVALIGFTGVIGGDDIRTCNEIRSD